MNMNMNMVRLVIAICVRRSFLVSLYNDRKQAFFMLPGVED